MKKNNNTVKESQKKGTKKTKKITTGAQESITIGIDPGDKASRYCVLNGTGEVTEEALMDEGPSFAPGRNAKKGVAYGRQAVALKRCRP